jgi:hypothetical protein
MLGKRRLARAVMAENRRKTPLLQREAQITEAVVLCIRIMKTEIFKLKDG